MEKEKKKIVCLARLRKDVKRNNIAVCTSVAQNACVLACIAIARQVPPTSML
jgi:hypothetical protein